MKYIVAAVCFILIFFKDIPVINCDCSKGYWGRSCEHPLECLIQGDNGVHYRGTMNVAADGTPCRNWRYSDTYDPPDGHNYNYCRHTAGGGTPNTWCYTSLGAKRCNVTSCQETCPPPNLKRRNVLTNLPAHAFIANTTLRFECPVGYVFCEPLECLIPGDPGVYYRGTKSVAANGKACYPWDANKDYGKPPDSLTNNYCRYLHPSLGCYTALESLIADRYTINRWGSCEIPICSNTTMQATRNCQKGFYSGSSRKRSISLRCECFSDLHVLGDSVSCQWSSDIPNCVDVDECKRNPCKLNAFCTNTQGSYTCQCNKGYVEDDHTSQCIDVDECYGHPCPNYAFCINTKGSYICPCNRGYIEDSRGQCIAICNKPLLEPNSRIVNEHQVYAYKEVIEIRCNPGYGTYDKRHFICLNNTHWNGTMPNCSDITCAIPELKNHSTALIKTSEIKYGDKVKIICDKGYTMKGIDVLQCQGNRLWDHETPICEGVLRSSKGKSSNVGGIVGGVMTVLVVIIVISVAVIIVRRRRRIKRMDDSSSATYLNHVLCCKSSSQHEP